MDNNINKTKKDIKNMDVPVPFDKMSTMHWFRQRVSYTEEMLNEQQQKDGLISEIFKGVRVYFDGHTDMVSQIHLKKLVLNHGGTHSHFKSSSCTHIIGTSLSLTKVEQMEKHHRKKSSTLNQKQIKPFYVHPNWILESCKQLVRLDENQFQIFTTTSSKFGDIRNFINSNNNHINNNNKRQFGLDDYNTMNEIDEYQLVNHLKKKRFDYGDEQDLNNVIENEELLNSIFYNPPTSSIDYMNKQPKINNNNNNNNKDENEVQEFSDDDSFSSLKLTPPSTYFKKIPRGQSKEII